MTTDSIDERLRHYVKLLEKENTPPDDIDRLTNDLIITYTHRRCITNNFELYIKGIKWEIHSTAATHEQKFRYIDAFDGNNIMHIKIRSDSDISMPATINNAVCALKDSPVPFRGNMGFAQYIWFALLSNHVLKTNTGNTIELFGDRFVDKKPYSVMSGIWNMISDGGGLPLNAHLTYYKDSGLSYQAAHLTRVNNQVYPMEFSFVNYWHENDRRVKATNLIIRGLVAEIQPCHTRLFDWTNMNMLVADYRGTNKHVTYLMQGYDIPEAANPKYIEALERQKVLIRSKQRDMERPPASRNLYLLLLPLLVVLPVALYIKATRHSKTTR